MRITNKMMSGNSLANINTNKEYLDKLNNQMATEKKITRPSDDPIIAIRALRLRSNLSEITQYYGANVPDAQAWVEVTQSAINSTKDMLSSLKSYADQGANGTNTASDRQKIYENMQALQKQIYSNGNATNAGRSVFTGYRTGESLTFKEDTTADYRGIWDTFNASDITKNTYVEGAPTLDEINAVNPTGDETTVKEDRVNRIRLSYDNISGSVRKGPTEGWDGDELGAVTQLAASDTYEKYFNEDGTLNDDGKAWNGKITVDGMDVDLRFNEPYDQTFKLSPEYTEQNIAGASASGTSDKIEVKVGDTTYTITNASGAYSVDKGASVTDDGSGKLTLTIPGPNGTKDIYSEVKVDASGSTPSLTSAKKLTKISEINYWLDNPKYSEENVSDASVTGDPDNMTVKVGASTYTITKDTSGYHVSPTGASVEDDGSGSLTLTIVGTDGTKRTGYTEIVIDASGTTPSLTSAEKYTRLSDPCDYAGGTNNGGIDLSGRAFGTKASDTTTLVYRTELTGQASISQNSVTTDPVDGLQSFELNYGGKTYKIQKFKDEDRWFAVDGSGHAIHNIEVVQNSDKSFKITENTSTSSSTTKTSNVFNVSANGRAVTSYYCEHYLDVQITDSNSSVFADAGGNELTAYQYLALGADDKNSDSTAANKIYLLADTGELVFGSDVAETLSSLKDIPGVDTISVMYDKSSFEAGELRPEHYFDTKQLDEKHNIVNKIVYDSHNQDINYKDKYECRGCLRYADHKGDR